MRIVLDAMGSDDRPSPDIEGAIIAARDFPGDSIILVGDHNIIDQALSKHNTTGLKLEIVHASQIIEMSDKPAAVIKDKPHSSIHVGLDLVKSGAADAFVTAGNTGATLAIATLASLGRISGVKRPALGSILKVPQSIDKKIILLDIGATVDAKPEWMTQFALMGSIYAREVIGINNPKVGLLSNGEEDSKGNQVILDTHKLLLEMKTVNFVGNIEPKEALQGGADVIVSDGFVGNIAIKSLEAMGSTIASLIRAEAKRDMAALVGALLMRPAFKRLYRQIDPSEIGGAPLLGLKGVVIIGHGRSSAHAIRNAIRQARLAVESKLVQAIEDGIQAIS
ncbi:MAG TPA: phosphate acyltransferase PlsX [Aggregatilineales bacterium]|nr:phosphate acyltransferase PlsX [Aggregatilineales bacterium]